MNAAIAAALTVSPLPSFPPSPVCAGAAPPYSLDQVGFSAPALAEAVGIAHIGGDRELALGSLMVARLMLSALPPAALSLDERTERAERTRLWLSGLTMPQPARMALLRAIDASAAPGIDATAALRELAQMLTGHLPDAALRELVTLAERLRLYYEETP
ncbi:MAG: hypothetical protein ACR2M1_00060 [Gemmatimonadaceae bacterium]